MDRRTVMVVGLGAIGYNALEFLARTPEVDRIVTVDVRSAGRGMTNNAMLGAATMGFSPEVEFFQLDVGNLDATASLLRRVKPAVILSTVTLQSYHVISELPKDMFLKLKLDAGYGPWTSMHIVLNYKLIKAVKAAGIDTHVVTAAFPDATNPILARAGLGPTVGLGNMDNFVPGIRKLAAQQLKLPESAITIYMVAHHIIRTAIKYRGNTGGAPFYLGVFADSQDVSKEFDPVQLLVDEVKFVTEWRNDSKVASSGVRNVLGILKNTGELAHSPGPNGLIGGYPIRLTRDGVQVVLPPGLNMETAIKINEEAQVYDGIEKIEADGTLVLTDKSVAVMREVLGFDRKRIGPHEHEDCSTELRGRYLELVAKYKR